MWSIGYCCFDEPELKRLGQYGGTEMFSVFDLQMCHELFPAPGLCTKFDEFQNIVSDLLGNLLGNLGGLPRYGRPIVSCHPKTAGDFLEPGHAQIIGFEPL